jgi:hypothetical protein
MAVFISRKMEATGVRTVAAPNPAIVPITSAPNADSRKSAHALVESIIPPPLLAAAAQCAAALPKYRQRCAESASRKEVVMP